jgi:hypothetical protein
LKAQTHYFFNNLLLLHSSARFLTQSERKDVGSGGASSPELKTKRCRIKQQQGEHDAAMKTERTKE